MENFQKRYSSYFKHIVNYNAKFLGTHTQYDAEIKPKIGIIKKIFGSHAEAVSTSAMSFYTDWAIKQRWICVDSNAVELDIKENTQRLSQIIICLIKPIYFSQGQPRMISELSVKTGVFKVK